MKNKVFHIAKEIVKAIFAFLTNRLFLLLLIVIGLFYVLLVRVFELTIVQGEDLAREFDLSVIRDVDIEGQRGNIYDRNGYPLAENVIAYNIILNDSVEVEDKNAMIHALVTTVEKNGDEIIDEFPLDLTVDGIVITGSEQQVLNFKKNVFNKRLTSQLTEEQIAMNGYDVFLYLRDDLFEIDKTLYTTEQILDILNIRYAQYIKRYSKYQPETIALNINERTLALVEENRDLFPGVSIVESPYRVYNDAPYFAHIIGYTRLIDAERLEIMEPLGYESDDTVGVIGIEEALEPYLRGYDGYQKVEVNSLGKTMLVLDEVEPVMGNDVYLTIDRDLQIKAYHILEQQLAEILTDKMRLSLPATGEQRYILLKDIYDSIFRYEMLDFTSLNPEDTYESSLITVFEESKTELTEQVIERLNAKTEERDIEESWAVYSYILDSMRQDGKLSSTYKSSEFYQNFKNGGTSFYAMIDGFIQEDVYLYDASSNSDMDTTYSELLEYIENDALKRLDYDKHLYLYLIDEEAFNYVALSITAVNHGIVTGSDEEIDKLVRKKLTPLEFMKQKILDIELTPQELALDPSSGSVVISDTDTGELLAMVSYPTYDNSRLVNYFDNDYYVELLNDPTSPLYPRATYSKSAPGSTFKMISGMAALEEGVLAPDEYVYSTGIFTKIFPAAKCWIYSKGGIHGSITVKEAIEESCNYFFYEMGYRLSFTEAGKYSDATGISTIEEYASRFGLDSKTGIEIGEADSTMATRDSARAMIGQGTHNYTPVQLARYMNALVNNGNLMELNLVDKVLNKNGEVVNDFTAEIVRENDFNEEYIELVKSGMLAVTEGGSGTARYYFSDLPISVAGKTGTAELVKTRPAHAVFTGFAPIEDPEISVVTVIQFGYSSKYAALNSKKIFSMYFDLESEPAEYSTGIMLD